MQREGETVKASTIQLLVIELVKALPNDLTDEEIKKRVKSPDFSKDFRKFLKGEKPPVQRATRVYRVKPKSVPEDEEPVQTNSRFTANVDYRYDLDNLNCKEIKNKAFPHDERLVSGKVTFRLYESMEGDTNEDILRGMSEVGLRPVNIWELVAITGLSLSFKFVIIGLGSQTIIERNKEEIKKVPMIGKASNEIRLCNSEVGWVPKEHRFAGVEI